MGRYGVWDGCLISHLQHRVDTVLILSSCFGWSSVHKEGKACLMCKLSRAPIEPDPQKRKIPQPLKTSLIPVFRLEFIDLITEKWLGTDRQYWGSTYTLVIKAHDSFGTTILDFQ